MPARRESLVILRHLSLGDGDEFIAAMRASRRLHGRWLSPPTTPEGFREWLRRAREEPFESLLPAAARTARSWATSTSARSSGDTCRARFWAMAPPRRTP